MKLVSFKECNEIKIGILHDDVFYDLRKVYASYLKSLGDYLAEKIAAVRIPRNMVKLIEGGEKAYEAVTES